MTKLLLIDAPGMMHRAWHGTKHSKRLTPKRFFRYVRDMAELFGPTHIALAFDPPKDRLQRTALYPAYKGGRSVAEVAQREIFDKIFLACTASGLPTLIDMEWEADDIIGTLAQMPFDEVMIASDDKDMAQLIEEHICVYSPIHRRTTTLQVAEASFGVEVDQIPDLLAIEGDKVDNIPGVRGIGRKGAQKALAALGDVPSILEAGLFEGRDSELALFLELTTIKTDLPNPLSGGDLACMALDYEDEAVTFLNCSVEVRDLSWTLEKMSR